MISPVNLKKNEMEDLSSDRIVRKWFQVKKAINFKISITYMYYFQSLIHCRMRRQSLCLVMATNQNSGIDVFFGAEFNFRVQIPDFRRAHHYKISKNLFQAVKTKSFCLLLLAWISQQVQNIFSTSLDRRPVMTCFEGARFEP